MAGPLGWMPTLYSSDPGTGSPYGACSAWAMKIGVAGMAGVPSAPSVAGAESAVPAGSPALTGSRWPAGRR